VFIELIDLLRCPREHEESWLVAAIYERSDRDIVTGRLGCPICKAAYPIEKGVAIFGDAELTIPGTAFDAYDETVEDAAMRCAAMLDLFDPGGAILLGGRWARAARALLDIVKTSVLVLAPPAGIELGNGVSAIRIGDRLPLAAGSLRGIALDATTATPALVSSAALTVRSGGRLIGPTSAPPPAGVIERARDDRHWVAEVAAQASAPVPLVVNRQR
jgi:uncharacterized protein YbaR (Trm112 family)